VKTRRTCLLGAPLESGILSSHATTARPDFLLQKTPAKELIRCLPVYAACPECHHLGVYGSDEIERYYHQPERGQNVQKST
jgi:hypothetical protein